MIGGLCKGLFGKRLFDGVYLGWDRVDWSGESLLVRDKDRGDGKVGGRIKGTVPPVDLEAGVVPVVALGLELLFCANEVHAGCPLCCLEFVLFVRERVGGKV